jgi:hypothetical protein
VNVKQSNVPKEIKTIKDAEYYDVIPYDQILICYVKTGILLYDISNPANPVKLGNYQY